MKLFLLACLAVAALLAGAGSGIPPLLLSTSYPVHQTVDNLTLAAALLSPAQASKVFGADIDGVGFLVFEVAAYPAEGARIDLSPDQFTLSVPEDGTLLATSSPEAVVQAMFKGKRPDARAPRKAPVSNPDGAGDGAAGTGRPGSLPPLDRDGWLVGLADREFPDTTATRPVAGYLYFARPRFKSQYGLHQLELILIGWKGRRIVLPLALQIVK
jgi:hypothetical protein